MIRMSSDLPDLVSKVVQMPITVIHLAGSLTCHLAPDRVADNKRLVAMGLCNCILTEFHISMEYNQGIILQYQTIGSDRNVVLTI